MTLIVDSISSFKAQKWEMLAPIPERLINYLGFLVYVLTDTA